MLVLKEYQKRTLAALKEFLTFARIMGPAEAFKRITTKEPTDEHQQTYYTHWGMENVPYVCLRLPTGGGKTLLAAYSIDIATSTFLERDYPFVFWLVPTKAIRKQTVEALKKPFHPYRETLDAAFGLGNVCIFDIDDINNIRPKDAFEKTCIIVATMQTLRVEDDTKDKRKVYENNENFEPHFKALPNTAPDLDRQDGQVLFSFVNMVHQLQPLVIVDEAHKMRSVLSRETMKRINPACVIEFTATPVESNVLYRVYPSELKEEEMVKLPFRLVEHSTWEQAITEAILNRKKLEEYADKDSDAYIRPIVLFQAEDKNKECTIEILKSFLLDNGIKESEIAIASGGQRELDGINLFDKTCPVKYIITIEALKEGWDCSFAYVFCSVVPNIRSATDVEQLLGRVMRMPYAKARKIAELNMAYAHVISKSFSDAATGMYGKMINMGFAEDEAANNIIRQLKLPGLEDETPWPVDMPLFPGASSKEISPVVINLKTKPDFTEIPQEELEHISIEQAEDGSTKITSTGMMPHTVENLIIAAANDSEKGDIRRKVALQRQQVASTLPQSQSQKQIPFEVPRMLVEIWGSLEWAEPEAILNATNWLSSEFNHHLTPEEFSYNPESQAFIFDLDGERMVYKQAGQVQYTLFAMPEKWDELLLSRWLDRKCRQKDIDQPQMLEFCRRSVSALISPNRLDLVTLYRAKDALAIAIGEKISKLRIEAQKKVYQELLFDPGAKVEVSFKDPFNYPFPYYAESIARYSGPYKFQKHYYPLPKDLKASGEEFRCAQFIDAHPKVESWVRNVDRQHGSFSLPTSTDKFYPDFVIKLTDQRLLVLEYKGAHLLDSDDSKEKRNIGELWASKSNGTGLFLLITEDAKAKNIAKEFNAALA